MLVVCLAVALSYRYFEIVHLLWIVNLGLIWVESFPDFFLLSLLGICVNKMFWSHFVPPRPALFTCSDAVHLLGFVVLHHQVN